MKAEVKTKRISSDYKIKVIIFPKTTLNLKEWNVIEVAKDSPGFYPNQKNQNSVL